MKKAPGHGLANSLSLRLIVLWAVVAPLIVGLAASPTPIKPTSCSSGRELIETYQHSPLSFEANEGQTDRSVKFLCRGNHQTVWFTPTEAVIALTARDGTVEPHDRKRPGRDVVRMQFIGASRKAKIDGLAELPGKSNYFVGRERKTWRTNVPSYERIAYRELYPGIDLVFHGTQHQLEYDFNIAAAADPARLRIAFRGADSLTVTSGGDLVVHIGKSQILQKKPVAYQEISGKRKPVSVRYELIGHKTVGIKIAGYDSKNSVVIDPVLTYSTYIGGTDNDFGLGIAVDAAGCAYITGYTESSNFPTTNPEQPASGGLDEAFVVKFNDTGANVVYSTYLGGSGEDIGQAIAVDSVGNAYIAGYTSSTDFPIVNAFQSSKAGNGLFGFVGFVTKLDVSGSALVYSTYLGGSSGYDQVNAIAIDDSGSVYVAGQTLATDFPTLHPLQAALAGKEDAFIAKFTPDGSHLVYSTYLGGSDFDYAYGVAVDGAGEACVTGATISTNFPTVNAFQPVKASSYDAFVAKLNRAGSGLVYSTYLGGNGTDTGDAISADAAGNVYIAGQTDASDFPTANAIQGSNAGSIDVFVTKINPQGSALVYSTYLGGNSLDRGFGIAIDKSGNAYITGDTESTNFPAVNAVQSTNGGGDNPFIVKLDPTGATLVYSTYLGGDGSYQIGSAIAVDSFGSAYITGATNAPNFPNTRPGALYPSSAVNVNPFVAKVSDNLLVRAGSRMIHGPAGTVDLNLPFDGSGIECRSGITQGDYTIILSFANNLLFVGGASVINGTGTVGSSMIDSNDSHHYIVNLSGVSNAQRITVSLSNVIDSAGNQIASVSQAMGVLLGDVNASGRVDAADVSLVRQQTLESVNISNFRADVNASGRIDAADVSIARQQTLTFLP